MDIKIARLYKGLTTFCVLVCVNVWADLFQRLFGLNSNQALSNATFRLLSMAAEFMIQTLMLLYLIIRLVLKSN